MTAHAITSICFGIVAMAYADTLIREGRRWIGCCELVCGAVLLAAGIAGLVLR